jgi:hypothetical protein
MGVQMGEIRLLPEDGYRRQSPKRYVFIKKQDNVQKLNNCINIPSSQTFISETYGLMMRPMFI